MPPSWRTRRVAAGEPVNIPADLDLFVKDLRQHGTSAEDDVNWGNTNLNEDMIVVVVITA